MSERTVTHATIVVERTYPASPARVFAAWADPVARRRWDVPGDDDWDVTEFTSDFRVGGREASRFGPKGKPFCSSDGLYLDIAPNTRIVSPGTMHGDDRRSSCTLCTVELLAEGPGTRLILTDQSVFLDGAETPAMREEGWGEILNKLGVELQRAPA